MAIVKYKLEVIVFGEGVTIPIGITDSGYYYSPIDNTFLGWLDTKDSEYYMGKSATAVPITKLDAISRVLDIHHQYPFMKPDENLGFSGEANLVPYTDQEVEDEVATWYDGLWNKNMGVTTGYIPTSSEVNDERERRIYLGCNVSISNVGNIFVTGRSEDIRNMTGLGQEAIVRIVVGDTTTVTKYRDGNNIIYDLLPNQMLELWQKSATYISDVYQSSWVLKANTIPLDFKSNSHWPSSNV